jgi:competence protein ComEC
MFRIALAFCAGAAAVHALPALLPAGAVFVPAIAAVFAVKRSPVVAAALAGFAWTHCLAFLWVADSWPCARDREEVELVGRVSAPSLEREDRTDFDLDVIRASARPPWPRHVRLSWYEADQNPGPGETWRFVARLRCRRGLVNPGAQDRELALLRERIDATGYVASKSQPERLSPPTNRLIARMRARIAAAISSALPPGPSVAVLQGLTVGVRGNIPDALWEAFAITGIAHLMAISGLHVTGCALSVLALLRLAWRMPVLARLPSRLAIETAVVVATTAAYALLSGASLPALRTLAMVAALAFLRWLRRTLPLHEMLALAAIALVASDPLALTAAGFWLSFIATAALLAVFGLGSGWRGRVAGFARAQIAITALLTPVLTASFGRVSLLAPAANAIAIPIFSVVILPAVLAGTALAVVAPGATSGIWRALAWLLDRTWPHLVAVASWPFAAWTPAAPSVVLIAAAGAALFAALLLPIAGLRLAAAVLVVAITCCRASRPAEGAFSLTAIDVGQGLAVVVETAHRVLVFDTGPHWRSGGEAARVSLLPYLRSRGIRRIDLLVVSHDDQDHAGGAELIRRSLRVSETMQAPGSLSAAGAACTRGRAWQWDGISFRVLHPPVAFHGSDNDRSCALSIAGPGGTALLLADPEAAAEAELGSQSLDADVVLLPHHGSRSSSSPELITSISARYGIASAGFGNRWGMPDRDVVARWRAAGTTVLVTADEGAIRARFSMEPDSVKIETERRKSRRWWRGG